MENRAFTTADLVAFFAKIRAIESRTAKLNKERTKVAAQFDARAKLCQELAGIIAEHPAQVRS